MDNVSACLPDDHNCKFDDINHLLPCSQDLELENLKSELFCWFRTWTKEVERLKETAELQERLLGQIDINNTMHLRMLCGFKEKYAVQSFLGKGLHGRVLQGHRRSDRFPVAIKVIVDSKYRICLPNEMKSVPWEVGIMAYLCKPPTCPSIIQLLDWYEMEKLLILVLEMPAPCLDLEKLIKLNGILTEPTAKHLFRQLAQALHHCESRGVFHRDVKPDNILVQFGTETLKLIDFGCSILHKGNSYIKFDGMLPFAPPELISEKRYQASSYTVWCYGCTLYYCLSRRLAPGVSGDNLNGKLHLATRFSKELEDFLCQCLSLSPEKRPTLKEILRHPWLLRS